MRRALLVFAAACSAHAHPSPAPGPVSKTLGALTVLTRDHDSGEVIAHAELALHGPTARTATSTDSGFATFDHLTPGAYELTATFAGQPVTISAIDVHPNQTSYLDVVFTLGHPDPIAVQFGETHVAAIDRYRPKDMNPNVARIEGTVTDSGSHARVEGAVVTAVDPKRPTAALQMVTDDQGRYRFDDVPPGTYAVSANYSIGGRGQVEVRRGDLTIAGGDALIVPLAIELAR